MTVEQVIQLINDNLDLQSKFKELKNTSETDTVEISKESIDYLIIYLEAHRSILEKMTVAGITYNLDIR